jgi:hypothetical protein
MNHSPITVIVAVLIIVASMALLFRWHVISSSPTEAALPKLRRHELAWAAAENSDGPFYSGLWHRANWRHRLSAGCTLAGVVPRAWGIGVLRVPHVWGIGLLRHWISGLTAPLRGPSNSGGFSNAVASGACLKRLIPNCQQFYRDSPPF